MNVNEYQKLAARTINKDLNSIELEFHALFGMCGEIGELHSMYQKGYQGHKFARDHYKKELGDLLWFITEYCTARGWTLEEIMQMNINKLSDRYPDGFDEFHSVHRAKDDI